MSGIDPRAIWLLFLTGLTMIIWGMNSGGTRIHKLLIVFGNAFLLGLALWRPEVRLMAITLLFISVANISFRHLVEPGDQHA